MLSNIYQEARRFSGKTQNEAANALYVHLRTLQFWEEDGTKRPSGEMVKRMAELYRCPWLNYLHMKETAPGHILPDVIPMGLCQAVLNMQLELGHVQQQIGKLIEIAADGMVDVSEADQFAVICREAEEAAGTLLTLALCGRAVEGNHHGC